LPARPFRNFSPPPPRRRLQGQDPERAPFAALFAADTKAPLEPEEGGFAVAGSRFTYAKGALALRASVAGCAGPEGKPLKRGAVRFLAAAGPDPAPYGPAVRGFLSGRGLLPAMESNIVTGDNVPDAFQAVKAGNAELRPRRPAGLQGSRRP
jgi:molybdate transport system substrate-binding protein